MEKTMITIGQEISALCGMAEGREKRVLASIHKKLTLKQPLDARNKAALEAAKKKIHGANEFLMRITGTKGYKDEH